LAAGCLAVVALGVPAGASATTWTFRALPGLPGSVYTSPAAINYNGKVVGASTPVNATAPYPVVWTPAGVINTLIASTGRATGINQAGLISGTMTSATFNTQAVYWQQGVMTPLPDMGNVLSEANAINQQGVMVGADETNPVYWPTHTQVVHYGSPPHYFGNDSGLAINTGGDIVGWSLVNVSYGNGVAQLPHYHPANGLTVVLPTPLLYGTATGINAAGRIVGTSWNTNNNVVIKSWAIRWTNQQPYHLSWATNMAGALGINQMGHIVGWGSTGASPSHALLWVGGQPTDLNMYRLYAVSCGTRQYISGRMAWS
jgi:probable HAF family extracellular repeat protein